jgi:hypothetical protein
MTAVKMVNPNEKSGGTDISDRDAITAAANPFTADAKSTDSKSDQKTQVQVKPPPNLPKPKFVYLWDYKGLWYEKRKDRDKAHLSDLWELIGIPLETIEKMLDVTVAGMHHISTLHSTKNAFKTSDGDLFNTEVEANEHEALINATGHDD